MNTYQDYKILGEKCPSCQRHDHNLGNCKLITYQPPKDNLINHYLFGKSNQRQIYDRNKRDKYNSLYYHDQVLEGYDQLIADEDQCKGIDYPTNKREIASQGGKQCNNKPRKTNIIQKQITSDQDVSEDDQDECEDDLGPNLELPEIPQSIDAISFFNIDAKFIGKGKENDEIDIVSSEDEEDIKWKKKSVQNLINNRSLCRLRMNSMDQPSQEIQPLKNRQSVESQPNFPSNESPYNSMPKIHIITEKGNTDFSQEQEENKKLDYPFSLQVEQDQPLPQSYQLPQKFLDQPSVSSFRKVSQFNPSRIYNRQGTVASKHNQYKASSVMIPRRSFLNQSHGSIIYKNKKLYRSGSIVGLQDDDQQQETDSLSDDQEEIDSKGDYEFMLDQDQVKNFKNYFVHNNFVNVISNLNRLKTWQNKSNVFSSNKKIKIRFAFKKIVNKVIMNLKQAKKKEKNFKMKKKKAINEYNANQVQIKRMNSLKTQRTFMEKLEVQNNLEVVRKIKKAQTTFMKQKTNQSNKSRSQLKYLNK